ncbi:MAG: TolC family protein [Phycisphaerales bacterium]
MFRSWPALSCAVFGMGAVITGCTTYEPRPLDPARHRADWHNRSAGDESVLLFADRLAERAANPAPAFDPDDGLTLPEGELVAMVFHPDLRLARLRAGVASASAEHAGRWDDPEFSIDVLRITEGVANPWIVTPGLAITIPISGRLGVERDRADAALRAEIERVAEQEWAVRHELRLAWLGWSAASLRLEEHERLLKSISDLSNSTALLAEAGELLRTEAALFAIERSQRGYELHRLRGAVAEAEQRVRAVLGLSPGAPIELVPSLDVHGYADDGGPSEAAAGNQTLARLRTEYEVAEQTLRREIRKQYPDLTIGPLYESDEGQSRVGLFGAIPVPVLNANKRGIAEAEAEREFARAACETEYERVVGRIAGARARARALLAEREHLVAELVPLVDHQLADARRLLELGEGGGLVLLESMVRAHETKMHLIDVRLDEARVRAELAFLSGPQIGHEDPEVSELSDSDSGDEVDR